MAKVKFKVGDKVIVSGSIYHFIKDKSEATIIGISDYGTVTVQGINKEGNKIQQTVFKSNLKLKTMTITKQEMKKAVETVANSLMRRDGNITTLVLRNELRVQYPAVLWNQYTTGNVSGVSDLFHELVREGKFKSIRDNGTYQTYVPTTTVTANQNKMVNKLGKALGKATTAPVVKQRGLVKGSATALAAGKAAAATRAANKGAKTITNSNTISRTKALDLIKNSKGQFIKVEFTKKDGSNRILNGQYSADIQPTLGLGLVTLRESVKAKMTPKDSLRQFDINRLKALRVKGVDYKVK